MKTMKKLCALVVALVMALAMTVTAFADGVTCTITAPATGHTYEVYQIIKGDVAGDKISNAVWGENASDDTADVETAMNALSAKTGETAILAEALKYVDITGEAFDTVASGATINVPAGYYLIKDVDDVLQDQDDAYTLYVLAVAGNATFEPKTDTPEVEKKVKDINDTTDSEMTDWQDSADYDIGDNIPYQLKATLGDLTHFQTYYVEFVDILTAGLTYNGDAKVYIDGNPTTAFTINYANGTLTAYCADVKAAGALSNSVITVEYTAKLNENAVVGSAGNPNQVYLKYSNNPNNSGDGTEKPDDTGKTPEDKVIVFTYKVVANKVDQDGNDLVGASFKLEKKDAAGNWVKVEEIDGTNASTFTWTGIDDGIYRITETKTPVGYNSIDPIEFTVSATHDTNSNDPKLTALDGGILGTGEVSTGTISTEIENKQGATLPTTGGMGTTVIYVIGAILVLGAGVLLITRRRLAK